MPHPPWLRLSFNIDKFWFSKNVENFQLILSSVLILLWSGSKFSSPKFMRAMERVQHQIMSQSNNKLQYEEKLAHNNTLLNRRRHMMINFTKFMLLLDSKCMLQTRAVLECKRSLCASWTGQIAPSDGKARAKKSPLKKSGKTRTEESLLKKRAYQSKYTSIQGISYNLKKKKI